jgi:hypothetical protein
VRSAIDGLKVEPARLEGGGPEELTLSLEALAPGTLLRGEIWLQTQLLARRVQVAGSVPRTEAGTEIFGDGQVLWEPRRKAEPEPPGREGADRITNVPPLTPPSPPVVQPVQSAVVSPPAPLPEGLRTPSTQKIVESVRVGAAEVIVSKLGGGDYDTIGEAIRGARSGARILVRPAVYREALVIDKKLEIVGDGNPGEVVVESAGAPCLVMRSDYARVKGLTLRGRADGKNDRYAVDVPQGQLILEDCDVTSEGLACLAVHGGGANPVVRNCRLHGGASAGVLVYDRGEGEFESCEIFENALAGVEVRRGGKPLLRRCKVHDCGQAGVLVHQNAEGTFDHCEVYANARSGVEIRSGANPVLKRCTLHDGGAAGVLVDELGRGRLEECDVFGNALAGVEVRGGGDPVLLRCKVRNGRAAGLLFTRGGKGTVEDCEIFENALAGVEIRKGGDPTLKGKCSIRYGKQFGVLVCDDGKGTLLGCDVFGNEGTGVAVSAGGNPRVQRCAVRQQKLAGVAVWQKGAGAFEDSRIEDNGAAGIVIAAQGCPTVVRCEIHGNGDAGVWATDRAAGRIEHCDLAGNANEALDIGNGCTVRLSQNKTEQG